MQVERAELARRSMDDMKWLAENYEKLSREYDGKWVAIRQKKVIEAAGDIKELAEAIKKYEQSETILVEYLTAKPIAMFF